MFGFIGCQKGNEIGQVFGLPHPFQRAFPHCQIDYFIPRIGVFQHGGFNQAGGDGVDLDAQRRELHREGADEARHAGLGGAVPRVAGDPDPGQDRGSGARVADEEAAPAVRGQGVGIPEAAVGLHPSNEYLFFIICCPVGAYYAEGFKPTKIYVEDRYVRAAAGGVGEAKTGGNYAASLKAFAEAKNKGCTQVLWLDALERKYVEEVGTSNIFFVINGELITPPLGGTILPGITRDTVASIALTGVDVISVGALTHSAEALDLSMKITKPGQRREREDPSQRVAAVKEALGERLVILGHHYQRDDVLALADYRGDSLKLARDAANCQDAKYIVFCGVHFIDRKSVV